MIEGRNVVIRQLELGDEEYLYKWWNDGNFMAHAALAYGTLESKEAIRSSIEKNFFNSQLYSENKTFIICKKDGMIPIGEMNYCGWDKRDQKCEFGIKIYTEEQGKGYGKDALSHFIDFMFRFLNLNKIELTSMIDNKRAHNLYKTLGFKKIGVMREAFFDSRTGSFSDVIYMDLLKREWAQLREELLKK